MNIAEFIKTEILVPRLKKKQILVVYDPDRRYRELCLELVTDKRIIVDATESSITSRMSALECMTALGKNEIEQVLIYIPKAKPLTEEDKQRDPFALYSTCGAVFPDGDGDSYLSLCLKSKPDYQTQIRSVFEKNQNPSFGILDAIGQGLTWPCLRSLMKVESTRDILLAILCPSDKQFTAFGLDEGWYNESIQLFQLSLGLSLQTKVKSWKPVSEELWSFVLFSEFVFDLPEPLPISLANVPHAMQSARPLVEDICEHLRNDLRTQSIYILEAERIESELGLAQACANLNDLGIRDTFPFEERTFLKKAISLLIQDNLDLTKEILARHSRSIWTGIGESQLQWDFLKASLALLVSCQDKERVLGDYSSSMDSLIDAYVKEFREVDQRHREFEQAYSDYSWRDQEGLMSDITGYVRQKYFQFAVKIQLLFTKYFQNGGWPITGRLANSEVFDKFITPQLEVSGKKVSFIMVDALRYELGVELVKQLSEDARTEITPALVQLPSITLVGMASLLPGASTSFSLKKTESGFVPQIQGQDVGNVPQRMKVIERKFGNRFQEVALEEFVRVPFTIAPDTDLLVLRSVEIDSQFENHPETAPSTITNALKRIRTAIYKLREAGFMEVVIATDHGFFMNTHAGAGDNCSKLNGNWKNVHERSLLGEGAGDVNHFCIEALKAGIKGDFAKLAGPLSLATYRSGMLYYHGGVSLQECVVPVIRLHLNPKTNTEQIEPKVKLSYKNGIKKITTRLPVVEISEVSDSLYLYNKEIEVVLEVKNSSGDAIGEAKPGGVVNPATGSITLKQGSTIKVTLKISKEDYEGKVFITASHPKTMKVFDKIELETDFTV